MSSKYLKITSYTSHNFINVKTNIQSVRRYLPKEQFTCLEDLVSLEKLVGLHKLEISCCSLTIIPYIDGLQELYLNHCNSITEDSISNIQNLKTLKINGCRSLHNIPQINGLQELYLTCCHSLKNIYNISGLQKLVLDSCYSLTNVLNIKELQILNICGYRNLTSTKNIPMLIKIFNRLQRSGVSELHETELNKLYERLYSEDGDNIPYASIFATEFETIDRNTKCDTTNINDIPFASPVIEKY
jgi:hypothetical protein